ncbi:helix-turn-helix transcriptional regulator [Microbacterium sp. PAMC22086]|uniref:helix-turn-helix domain-containing protein n=1 Tax=Microbacterium sp. PAMC22086 TaxID=2861281 RepID=UPI001C6383FD|nr:helix-turn-helix transcriptional regulator [Microbacterium sp. PAMC22086]QYG11525.1 helix-turn-helix transcriptional regulator [Microbacterium sp. PAMC22086]
MTRVETVWNLRKVMFEHQLFKTTDLIPLLAQYGVHLSREQVFRLVTHTPERANMQVIGAVCAALGCTPSDLIEVRVIEERRVAVEQTRQPIGDIRPRPASIRRPPSPPA